MLLNFPEIEDEIFFLNLSGKNLLERVTLSLLVLQSQILYSILAISNVRMKYNRILPKNNLIVEAEPCEFLGISLKF